MKSQKGVTKHKKSRFLFLFCLMMEGSGCVPTNNDGSGSWSPKTYGFGSTTLSHLQPFIHIKQNLINITQKQDRYRYGTPKQSCLI